MDVWSPLRFNCGREMANRFAMAPLTTDSSHVDGTVADEEIEFIRRRAASGFGAVISSATYVEQDGRSWQGTGAAHDGHQASLRRLAEAMRAAGGLAILQICDGGRIAQPVDRRAYNACGVCGGLAAAGREDTARDDL